MPRAAARHDGVSARPHRRHAQPHTRQAALPLPHGHIMRGVVGHRTPDEQGEGAQQETARLDLLSRIQCSSAGAGEGVGVPHDAPHHFVLCRQRSNGGFTVANAIASVIANARGNAITKTIANTIANEIINATANVIKKAIENSIANAISNTLAIAGAN